jgi:hypothetical protein
MRHKGRTMLTALVAVLAFGVAVSASASAALPEFSKTAKFVGTASHPEFRWPGGGRYELWSYGSGTFSGTIATASTVTGVGAEFHEGKNACYDKAAGEVMRWEGLKGRIGYLNKAKKEVGLLIGEPVTTPIAKCEFPEYPRQMSGNLVGKITPVNVKTKKFELVFRERKEDEQEFTKFEGEENAFPLLFGNYTCEETIIGKSCSASGEKIYATIGITLETSVETELKA